MASINTIAGALGGSVVDSIPGANIYLLNVPLVPSSLDASLLGIQWLELNTSVSLPNFALPGVLTVPGATPADWYKSQPSWQLIRTGEALPYSAGRGVVVADINSQVDFSHPALLGHLTSGYDFVASKPDGYGVLEQSEMSQLEQSEMSQLEQSEMSQLEQSGAILEPLGLDTLSPAYSHGTLCVGVIAAIAPESMIMPLRTFDDNGQTDLFMIAKAIRWAVQHGAQVINMSFGTAADSKAIKNSIEYAKNSNVVLVASAGNTNTSAVHYPSGYAGVLSTAATDLLDRKASFSNYGSTIFVDAPGSNIFGPYPGGYYTIASGTSFAAPAVAGTAALIRSLRTTGVAGDISAGAVNIDSLNPNYVNQLGYGRIDVLRAVKPN
ncbi:MAG: S8 family serine peptidase [Acidobacteria bacterium]|nr:S8 family serine peptidase [Acidobacteriota bacterium]